jgi:hypothetical protein
MVNAEDLVVDQAFDEVNAPQPSSKVSTCERHGGASSPRCHALGEFLPVAGDAAL